MAKGSKKTFLKKKAANKGWENVQKKKANKLESLKKANEAKIANCKCIFVDNVFTYFFNFSWNYTNENGHGYNSFGIATADGSPQCILGLQLYRKHGENGLKIKFQRRPKCWQIGTVKILSLCKILIYRKNLINLPNP
jgi:hypothetical protein